jgi:NADH-quinone oxidoreductase subunit H
VAGYNVEYSAFTFAAFFLGEYSNILIMSAMFVIFFLGGGDFVLFGDCKNISYSNMHNFFLIMLYDFFLGLKIVFINFIFVFIRANLPRFRFDQLMFIG